MSHPGGPAGPGGIEPRPCDCDPEDVFELADERGGLEGLDLERKRRLREHLACCSGCRELYRRETDLNAFLNSLDLSASLYHSVSQGVAMALPTRSRGARVLWGSLASVLLVTALVFSELNGVEPVILLMSLLGACWGFAASLTDVARAFFAAAGPTILLVLALGALADILIALAVVSLRWVRRTREA